MYTGRIVVIGMAGGRPFAGYRVSSRSFPNRIAVRVPEGIAVQPLDPEDLKRNPYIAYNALRISKNGVIATNGSHTDPIFDALEAGATPAAALRKVLEEMGYEKDHLNTPRIAGIISGGKGYLGIVRDDGCDVESFGLRDGFCRIITTYELNHFDSREYPLDFDTAEAGARFIVDGGDFAGLEKPVCSCVYFGGETAICNPHA